MSGNEAPESSNAGDRPEAATRKMTANADGLWEPPPIDMAAQLFPGYEVLVLLGRGGMGAVYQARQIELDRLVAIKLLPLEISADADFADRFRREARAMAKLNHPNIISVYDFGKTEAGHLFFVMEFVDGANLHFIIRTQELNADQALWLAGQVCTALAYAHAKGVVHRDVKPANVMVDSDGNAKVADFGLARLTGSSTESLGHTRTGTVMGTPDYMAPEQMRGMDVDHRADIYSLGVMLYEMLCREVPRGIFSSPSAQTGCDARIDSIVLKAMQSEPDRRYQSTQEMQADIETARASPEPSSPARTQPRAVGQGANSGAPSPKSKSLPYIGVGAVVVLLGALAFILIRSSTPRDNAVAQASVSESDRDRKPEVGVALDPRAVRLWRTVEDAAGKPGVAVEGGVLRLTDRGITYGRNRNAIVQVEIRADRDAKILHVRLRDQGEGKAAYIAALYFESGEVQLRANQKVLKIWGMPRNYAAGEWVVLQFQAVNEELKLSLEGQELGTVSDHTVSDTGSFTLYAGGVGHFRDVVYVPLDKEGASPSSKTDAPTRRTPASPKTVAQMPIEPVPVIAGWEDATAAVRMSAAAAEGWTIEGALIRGSGERTRRIMLPNGGRRHYAVRVRFVHSVQVNLSVSDDKGFLYVIASPTSVQLSRWLVGMKTGEELSRVLTPASHDPAAEHEVLVTMRGSKLRTWLNGRFVGELTDDALPEGECSVQVLKGGAIREVALAPLAEAPRVDAQGRRER